MRKGHYKLIEFFETGEIELYDLSKDASEKRNLVKTESELATKIHKELKQWQAKLNAPRPCEPNPDFDPSAVKKKGRDQRGKGRKE